MAPVPFVHMSSTTMMFISVLITATRASQPSCQYPDRAIIANEMTPLNNTNTTAHQSFDMVAESRAGVARDVPRLRSSTCPSMRQGGVCPDAMTHLGTEQLMLLETDAETMCLDLAGSTENDCKFAERRCTDFGMCISLNLEESEPFADAQDPLNYRAKSAVDMKIDSVTKALSHGSDADGFYLSRVLQRCAAVAAVDSSPGLGRKRSMSHKEWNKLVHAMIGNTVTTKVTTTKVTTSEEPTELPVAVAPKTRAKAKASPAPRAKAKAAVKPLAAAAIDKPLKSAATTTKKSVRFATGSPSGAARSPAAPMAARSTSPTAATIAQDSIPTLKLVFSPCWDMSAEQASCFFAGQCALSQNSPGEFQENLFLQVDNVLNSSATYDTSDLDENRKTWIATIRNNLALHVKKVDADANVAAAEAFASGVESASRKGASGAAPDAATLRCGVPIGAHIDRPTGGGGGGLTATLEERILRDAEEMRRAAPLLGIIPGASALVSGGANADPTAGLTAQSFMPDKVIEGGTEYYEYPDPGQHASQKTPANCVKLTDSTQRVGYRTWRLDLMMWLATCVEMKYTESTVRTSLVHALGDAIRREVVNHFGSALPKTRVGDIIQYLDVKYQMMASVEERDMENAFINLELKADETLQVFLQRYRTIFKRAWNAGFRPASNVATQLMKKVFGRYLKGGEHHARLIAKEQKHEAEIGRKMSYWERHSFALDFFDLIAKSMEDLRYERSQMFTQPEGGKKANVADANANAAGAEPKKRKRGGRGGGTTTTTTTTKANVAESESPVKKQVKKEATDTAPGSGVNVTVNFSNPNGKGKGKQKGKGKGGGKDKGGGKGKKKGKGKGGKGGGGGFDFKKPNPVQPMSWNKDNGDWKCTHPNCGWFNWQRNDKCQWCQSKKGYQHKQ